MTGDIPIICEYDSRVTEIARNLQRQRDGKNEYYLIANFGKSNVATEDTSAKSFFRVFTPVRPEKHRKLNSTYGGDFDIFEDSLLDYPTIIRYKLEKTDSDWKKFNRLISVHVSECPLNCWHCYLEECVKNSCGFCNCNNCDKERKNTLEIERGWFSAKFIVDSFLEQQAKDASQGIDTNVLRITGGEPLLIPNFLLEILKEIKMKNKENEIFVWTETNLVPLFIKEGDFYFIPDTILTELAEFNNFCIHPCFHGLNKNQFQDITGYSIDDHNLLFEALTRLIKNKIDIYPSFGSNVSEKDSIENFFQKISEIDPLLPLRFALIEYTNYPAIAERMKSYSLLKIPEPPKYDKRESIKIWNALLKGTYNKQYAALPRHLIPYSSNDNLIHLFKWPSKIEFQQKLLEIISLPPGSLCCVKYDSIWVNDYFELQFKDLAKLENKSAIFWILCCQQIQEGTSLKTDFKFACPFRKVMIKKVRQDGKSNYFDIILLEYFEQITKMSLSDLKMFTKIPFTDGTFPYPGIAKGFVFFGYDQEFLRNPSTKEIDLPNLFSILSEIPALNSVNSLVSDYPLIKIDDLQIISPTYWEKVRNQTTSQLNKDGKFLLKLGRQYEVNFTFYQGENEERRARQITINSTNFIGKSDKKRIPISSVNANQFVIDVTAGEQNYRIELPIKFETPLLKKKWLQYIILIAISIILFLLGFFVFHLDNASLVSAVIPIVVIFIDKIWR